jgi:hypothetical protein
VKVVFVAGFFTPVLEKLQERFSDQLTTRSIVWIRQAGPGAGANIKDFRENFNDRLAAGATDVLVLLAVLRWQEHIVHAVRGVIEAGQGRWPRANVRPIVEVRDAAATDLVVERICGFELPTVPLGSQVSMELLQEKLAGGRVLCVRETNHTSFRKAFERAGFPVEAWGTFLDEEVFDHGRLSTLTSWLRGKSQTYRHILYAWHGLRHVGDREQIRCQLHQGGEVREVVDRFKTWILAEGPPPGHPG